MGFEKRIKMHLEKYEPDEIRFSRPYTIVLVGRRRSSLAVQLHGCMYCPYLPNVRVRAFYLLCTRFPLLGWSFVSYLFYAPCLDWKEEFDCILVDFCIRPIILICAFWTNSYKEFVRSFLGRSSFYFYDEWSCFILV